MKIFFDHQIFNIQKYGGISNYFYNLIKILETNAKLNVKIFSPFYINEYINNLKNNTVTGFKLNFNKILLNEFINKNLINYGISRFKPDLVHSTYYNVYDTKIKKVLTVYDMIHEKYPNYFINQKLSEKKKISCNHADHIICISNNTKIDLIEKFKIKESKISVIYLGADHLNQIESRKLNIEFKFILYVGSRKNYKNFRLLLKAYKKSKLIQNDYKIISYGGERVDEITKKEITDLEIPLKNIIFMEGDDADLKNLYENASLFVYPSEEEGFGIPPLEAINLNCPILISNIPVLKEIIGSSANYFNSNDENDLLRQMENILYNKMFLEKNYKEISALKKKYSWENCANKTLELYNNII